MATAQGLKRTLILPIIAGGLALVTIGGYYAVQYASAGSKPAAVEVKPAPTLEERVTTVAVAPQIIEKPATLQEIGGIEGITKDYIIHVAKWAGQELGYPMDSAVKINFLSPDDYAEQIKKTPNSHLIANSIAFISPDGLNIYIKETVEPFKLVGLALNETGKAQIGYLHRQGKINIAQRKLVSEIGEAAAFAYQAAAKDLLEDRLGFKDFFAPPIHYEENDLALQLYSLKKQYAEKKSMTVGGYVILVKASEEIDKGMSKIALFEFLLRQNDAYAEQALQTVDERNFLAMAKRIVARKGNPLFAQYNYYDNKLP